jgi:hypothetical protein
MFAFNAARNRAHSLSDPFSTLAGETISIPGSSASLGVFNLVLSVVSSDGGGLLAGSFSDFDDLFGKQFRPD